MHISLQKKYLPSFFLILKGTEGQLTLPEARIRDRFIPILVEQTSLYEDKERRTIYEKFCLKHEDGSPDVQGDEYHFPREVIEDMKKEVATLNDEEVTLDIPDGIKEIMEKSAYKPKIGEVEQIDHIITLLK